jgi:hypothetical protein
MTSNDPIDLLQDENGDVVIPLQHARGLQAARQGIRNRLLLFRGEWFLDLDAGVPWFQRILGHKFVESIARAELRAAILDAPGVVDITELNLSFNRTTRVLTVAFRVRAAFDDLTGNVSDSLDLEAS